MRKQIYPTKNSCRRWLKAGLKKRKILKKKEKRKIA